MEVGGRRTVLVFVLEVLLVELVSDGMRVKGLGLLFGMTTVDVDAFGAGFFSVVEASVVGSLVSSVDSAKGFSD